MKTSSTIAAGISTHDRHFSYEFSEHSLLKYKTLMLIQPVLKKLEEKIILFHRRLDLLDKRQKIVLPKIFKNIQSMSSK